MHSGLTGYRPSVNNPLMKKLALTFLVLLSLGLAAQAGPEVYSGKDVKQVAPPPCPEWYADNEWNVSVWGTYAFTGNDWRDDRYIDADHAWGGGLDAKYFFHRYFGVGIEGWAVDSNRETFDLNGTFQNFTFTEGHEHNLIGSVLGTFTLRYPFQCSRFAPYVWAGGGGIFGGGQRDELVITNTDPTTFATEHHGARTELVGQLGGGMEVRFTRHIGWVNDFSWNVVDGINNNFGMVRSGINFAF
jgi:hypothetical protein